MVELRLVLLSGGLVISVAVPHHLTSGSVFFRERDFSSGISVRR